MVKGCRLRSSIHTINTILELWSNGRKYGFQTISVESALNAGIIRD